MGKGRRQDWDKEEARMLARLELGRETAKRAREAVSAETWERLCDPGYRVPGPRLGDLTGVDLKSD